MMNWEKQLVWSNRPELIQLGDGGNMCYMKRKKQGKDITLLDNALVRTGGLNLVNKRKR